MSIVRFSVPYLPRLEYSTYIQQLSAAGYPAAAAAAAIDSQFVLAASLDGLSPDASCFVCST